MISRKVLELLRQHKLYANLMKCSFVESELEYLGHIISADGIMVDPRKVAAVAHWRPPMNVGELRSFLGLATYFRKFVRDFAKLASPLYRLLRQDVSWAWSAVCQEAFNHVNQALTNAPCLAHPDFSKNFEVHCDAALSWLGAVLYQDGRPVAYESRRLTPAEVNYPTGEQELLTVMHALTVWRCYLEGAPEFRVVTDHKAITYLDNLPTLSRRQTRWAEFLLRFKFRWDSVPGTSNVVADALSQHPADYLAPCPITNALAVGGCLHPAHRCLPTLSLCALIGALRSAGGRSVAAGVAVSWKDKFVQGYTTDPWF